MLYDDIIYNLLLNSDINSIQVLCKTNQYAHQLCHSEQFWKSKYLHDQFLMIDEPIEWKHKYMLMTKIIKDVHYILQINKSSQQLKLSDGEIVLNFKFNN